MAQKFPTSRTKTRVAFSTANTARDGTGTLGTVATGTAGGSKVPDDCPSIRITCQTAAPAEDVLRLFSDNATNKTLLGEFYVRPESASGIKPGWSMSFPIPIESRALATTSDTLKISTNIGNSYQAEITLDNY